MRKLILFLIFSCFYIFGTAQDTFSIVAVDPATGEIGSAAASCVDGVPDDSFVDFLTVIIPNRGGIMSQALICTPNPNLANAAVQMDAGSSPTEIIDYLLSNDDCAAGGFNPEWRQYGIADFDEMGNPRTAGFTGSLNEDYAEDRQGTIYSIQGNILLNVSVIDNMEANFLNTEGTLADKLMAALQGANFPGADSRCLEDGTSSKLAYLMVYRPDDDPADPYLKLAVPSQPVGVEPIDVLQSLYDNFLSTSDFELIDRIRLFPNPVIDELNIKLAADISEFEILICDAQGREVIEKQSGLIGNDQLVLDVSSYNSGIYFLKISTSSVSKTMKFIKH